MTFEDNILDAGQMRDNSEYRPNIVEYTVEGITRLGHYIIDHIARYVLLIFFVYLFEAIGTDLGNLALLCYIPYFIYYPLMEFYFGKTIGKILTKSTVVSKDGGKITFGQAVGRSLCRLIPFNSFSFLGASAIGWHDRISKTRVVSDTFFEYHRKYD